MLITGLVVHPFVDQYFDGTMAFLRFWHGTLLTQEDVTELYNSANSTNLVSYNTNLIIHDTSLLSENVNSLHILQPEPEETEYLIGQQITYENYQQLMYSSLVPLVNRVIDAKYEFRGLLIPNL